MDSSALTHQQLEQEYLQNEDFNGSLDACNGQTIVDYITREMGCPLQRAVHEDPAASLRQWIKLYKQGQFKGLMAGAIGVVGVLGGFMVGSRAWSAVSAIGLGMGFFTFKNHKEATEFSQHEEMVLNQLPGILDHLANLEASGIRTSAIVSRYNYLILSSFHNPNIDPQNPHTLREYLEIDKQTSQVFQEYSPIPQPIAPAPSPKKAIGPTTRLNAVETDAVRMLDNTPIPSWKPAVEASVVPQDKPLREEPVEDYWGKGDSMGSFIDKAMGQIQQAYLREEPIRPQASPNVPEEIFQESQEPIAPITFSEPSTNVITRREPHPVDYLIGNRMRSSLIAAVSGGGKDVLLSNATRKLLSIDRYKDFQLLIMDCKDDPKEYGYYEGLPNTTVCRMDLSTSSDGEIVEWVDDVLEIFKDMGEKSLLICNEGTMVREKSDRYVGLANLIVSSGDSREKYIWEAGQSGHTKDLRINGAARSRFRPMVIGMKGEEMQIAAIMAASFVSEECRNWNDIKGQIMRSPVNRAWSDGRKWYAMPELFNYAGYNRDSRSFVQQESK